MFDLRVCKDRPGVGGGIHGDDCMLKAYVASAAGVSSSVDIDEP